MVSNNVIQCFSTSVSYTHLDVYKRQQLECALKKKPECAGKPQAENRQGSD